MLQMTKLAQFCQNFAQQLQEETEQANNIAGSGEEEIPKISVNLGDLADIQAHRQRQLEAQVTVFKLLDTDVISCVCVCVHYYYYYFLSRVLSYSHQHIQFSVIWIGCSEHIVTLLNPWFHIWKSDVL